MERSEESVFTSVDTEVAFRRQCHDGQEEKQEISGSSSGDTVSIHSEGEPAGARQAPTESSPMQYDYNSNLQEADPELERWYSTISDGDPQRQDPVQRAGAAEDGLDSEESGNSHYGWIRIGSQHSRPATPHPPCPTPAPGLFRASSPNTEQQSREGEPEAWHPFQQTTGKFRPEQPGRQGTELAATVRAQRPTSIPGLEKLTQPARDQPPICRVISRPTQQITGVSEPRCSSFQPGGGHAQGGTGAPREPTDQHQWEISTISRSDTGAGFKTDPTDYPRARPTETQHTDWQGTAYPTKSEQHQYGAPTHTKDSTHAYYRYAPYESEEQVRGSAARPQSAPARAYPHSSAPTRTYTVPSATACSNIPPISQRCAPPYNLPQASNTATVTTQPHHEPMEWGPSATVTARPHVVPQSYGAPTSALPDHTDAGNAHPAPKSWSFSDIPALLKDMVMGSGQRGPGAGVNTSPPDQGTVSVPKALFQSMYQFISDRFQPEEADARRPVNGHPTEIPAKVPGQARMVSPSQDKVRGRPREWSLFMEGESEGANLQSGRGYRPDNHHEQPAYRSRDPRQTRNHAVAPILQMPHIPMQRPALQESRPNVLPSHFDGKSSWKDWKVHFEATARLNGWSEDAKAAYLAVSLRGQAQAVLGDLEEEQRENYFALVAALEQRFGSDSQCELQRSQLRSRVRGKNESLPELAQAINRLAKEAYPEASYVMQNTLAMENFVECLDSELRKQVMLARPRFLESAVRIATELDAYRTAEKQRERGRYARMAVANDKPSAEQPRGMNNTGTGPGNMTCDAKQIAAEVFKMLEASKTNGSPPSSPQTSRKQNVSRFRPRSEFECYRCGEKGHLYRDCPNEPRCSRCGGEGHWSRLCPKRLPDPTPYRQQYQGQQATLSDMQGNDSLLGPRPMTQQ